MKKIAFLTLGLSCLFCLFSASTWAQFSNNYQQPIGNRASGLGGAFVAIADDATALWYNPAGLAHLTSTNINVSASIYSLLRKRTSGFLEFERLDGSLIPLDLNQSELVITPSTVSFGRELNKKVGYGFGLFVPLNANLTSKLEGEVTDTNGDNIKIRSEENSKEKPMSAMAGMGIEVTTNWSLGLAINTSLFTKNQKESNTWFEKDADADQSLFHNYEEEKSRFLAAALSIGTKFNLGAHHSIGLQAVSPLYTLAGDTKEEELDFNIDGDTSTTSNDISKTTRNAKAGGRLRPARASIGYAFVITNDFAISTEVEAVFAYIDTPNFTINGKLGFEKYFGSMKAIRLGFFTDFSQANEVVTTVKAPSKIDYYGASLSYSFAHKLTVISEEKRTNKLFSTTFGALIRTGSGTEQTSRYTAAFVKQLQTKNISVLNFKVFVSSSISF